MLFVALIVLIIMTLAGLALLRQMGTGTSIAGNIAFKENATSVADRGTEFANAWLIANYAITATDSVADGYLSSWGSSVDPTTFDWDAQAKTLIDDQAQTGNTTRFIIQRLCRCPTSAPSTRRRMLGFARPQQRRVARRRRLPGRPAGDEEQAFFRITTRVDGPRNTISYTQVLVQ